MRTFLLSLFSFFTFLFTVQAQITFEKTYGGIDLDYGRSVKQTTDGGYIISGVTRSLSASENDVYLVRTAPNGNSLWTKSFGGTNDDYGFSVQRTTDGGYIIAGSSQSFGSGGGDVYLIKTDVKGDSLWTKTFGGIINDIGYSVQQTTDGGYIIAGVTRSFGAGLEDVYLIKTAPNGDTLWTKTFGGTSYDEGYSVQQTVDGGYIIAGYTASFGAGNWDVYLIRTDANGDSLWTKTFGGTNDDWGNSIQQTADSGYIISGWTYSFGAGLNDVYLIRTNANGDSLWTKTFGGTSDDYGYSVQQTTDGGYIILGYTASFGAGLNDVYLIRTAPNGNPLWTKTFGGANYDYGYSVQKTTDGGYIITGSTESFGAGAEDVYLIKTDSLGNVSTTIDEKQKSEQKILVYPNPFTTSATLRITNSELRITEIKIFNLLGEEIKNYQLTTNNYQLKRSDLPAGIYLLKAGNQFAKISIVD